MSSDSVLEINLPMEEELIAVLWRRHFSISSIAESDWNSVEAASAHVSKFYEELVNNGLEGSKLPDEILQKITAMLDHRKCDVASPTSNGLLVLQQASKAFYTGVLTRVLWATVGPSLPLLAVEGYKRINVRVHAADLVAWQKLHHVEGMDGQMMMAAARAELAPRMEGLTAGNVSRAQHPGSSASGPPNWVAGRGRARASDLTGQGLQCFNFIITI